MLVSGRVKQLSIPTFIGTSRWCNAVTSVCSTPWFVQRIVVVRASRQFFLHDRHGWLHYFSTLGSEGSIRIIQSTRWWFQKTSLIIFQSCRREGEDKWCAWCEDIRTDLTLPKESFRLINWPSKELEISVAWHLHRFGCFSEGRLQCLDVGGMWGLEGKKTRWFLLSRMLISSRLQD